MPLKEHGVTIQRINELSNKRAEILKKVKKNTELESVKAEVIEAKKFAVKLKKRKGRNVKAIP